MREILFRGKDVLTGEWLYGDLIQSANEEDVKFIVPFAETNTRGIISETIGQFTGLCDKNGQRIFEGDIVRCKNYHGTVEGYIGYSKSGVYFLYCISGYSDEYLFNCADIEVISNVYDNPELLKGDDKAE